jgi:hypothetical protein
MIRRVLAIAFLGAFFVGSAAAGSDIDRHGTYSEKNASGAAVLKCKTFSGTDDNRGACTDWCTTYTTANADATCACDESACPEAPPTPQAAAAPVSAP